MGSRISDRLMILRRLVMVVILRALLVSMRSLSALDIGLILDSMDARVLGLVM